MKDIRQRFYWEKQADGTRLKKSYYPVTCMDAIVADDDGTTLKGKLSQLNSGKVDKVTGKGLSTNDYTDAEKAKVASALTQHQDISGKQDKLVAGSGITIAEDGKTISASGGGSSVTVVDGLTSDSSTDALSAKQGKVLNGSITDLAQKVGELDDLETTAKTNLVAAINEAAQSGGSSTPSGDVLHQYYISHGATYNDSNVNVTVKPHPYSTRTYTLEPHKWHYNGANNLTNIDMQYIFLYTVNAFVSDASCAFRDNANIKAIAALSSVAGKTTISLSSSFYSCVNLQSFVIERGVFSGNRFLSVNTMKYAFYNCNKLEYAGKFDVSVINSPSSMQYAFNGCQKLEEVYLKNLKVDLPIQYSPNLYASCVAFAINNVAVATNITITLHADAYARAMADADVQAALEAHTNVSLVSA